MHNIDLITKLARLPCKTDLSDIMWASLPTTPYVPHPILLEHDLI